MTTPVIIDVIAAAVLIAGAVWGARRGLFRALAGLAVIFFVNYFLETRGLDMAVGMGPVSFLTSGVLGIPGVALLYGIVLYQSL